MTTDDDHNDVHQYSWSSSSVDMSHSPVVGLVAPHCWVVVLGICPCSCVLLVLGPGHFSCMAFIAVVLGPCHWVWVPGLHLCLITVVLGSHPHWCVMVLGPHYVCASSCVMGLSSCTHLHIMVLVPHLHSCALVLGTCVVVVAINPCPQLCVMVLSPHPCLCIMKLRPGPYLCVLVLVHDGGGL